MREMKNSGIAWMGEIPREWNISRIKYVADVDPSCDKTKIDGDSLITYTPMECIRRGNFVNKAAYLNSVSSSLTAYEEGDIVMAKVTPCFENGNIAIMTGLHNGFGLGSSELFVFRPRSIVTEYLFYWLQNYVFVQNAKATMTGTGGLKRVSPVFIKNCSIHMPPKEEQNKLVAFLDSKCTLVDTLIQNVQTQIEKLKAYKQSLITEVVTKGLDPTVPMKDSGVDWIGHIPNAWEVKPMLREIETVVDYRGKTPEKVDAGILLVTARNIKDGKIDYSISQEYVRSNEYEEIMHRGKLNIGDILFTTEAPLGAVANVDRTDFALAQRIIKFTTKSTLNPYYLKYWMLSLIFQQHLKSYATGSTASGIKASKLCLLKLVNPPRLEQDDIVSYLDKKCAQIDRLIAIKQAKIEKLEQYKRSLIYEYVTGKKEVI